MAEFETAYEPIRAFEGGYDNDPDDRGGETYAGIARNYFPNWQGWQTVDNYKKTVGKNHVALSKALGASPSLQKLVANWYEAEWWQKLGLACLPQNLANEIFEQAVNLGKAGHGKKLQTICNAWNYNQEGKPFFTDLAIDGAIGPKTLAALKTLIKYKCGEAEFVHCLNAMQATHYIELAAKKASQRKYIKGWIKRTYDPVGEAGVAAATEPKVTPVKARIISRPLRKKKSSSRNHVLNADAAQAFCFTE